jgi:hypothetical protein
MLWAEVLAVLQDGDLVELVDVGKKRGSEDA